MEPHLLRKFTLIAFLLSLYFNLKGLLFVLPPPPLAPKKRPEGVRLNISAGNCWKREKNISTKFQNLETKTRTCQTFWLFLLEIFSNRFEGWGLEWAATLSLSFWDLFYKTFWSVIFRFVEQNENILFWLVTKAFIYFLRCRCVGLVELNYRLTELRLRP